MLIMISVFVLGLSLTIGSSSFGVAGEGGQERSCLERFHDLHAHPRKLNETREAAQELLRKGITLPPEAKAVLLNNDRSKAGYFIEIGTAQSVARFIDISGQRSNTILKAASYNGMTESDARYNKSNTGYVSYERISSILDVEQRSIEQIYGYNLESKEFPSQSTKFFVFADSVATRPDGNGHAWMGLRFQTKPLGPWQTVKIHVYLIPSGKK